MMNYVLAPLYSPYYCLLLPPGFSGLNSVVESSDVPEPSSKGNAEINKKSNPRV